MNWFRAHLDWTLFFALLIASILFTTGTSFALLTGWPSNVRSLNVEWLSLAVLAVIVMLGAEIWYLKQKSRSYFFLFFNLGSPWLGLFVLFFLSNKSKTN